MLLSRDLDGRTGLPSYARANDPPPGFRGPEPPEQLQGPEDPRARQKFSAPSSLGESTACPSTENEPRRASDRPPRVLSADEQRRGSDRPQRVLSADEQRRIRAMYRTIALDPPNLDPPLPDEKQLEGLLSPPHDLGSRAPSALLGPPSVRISEWTPDDSVDHARSSVDLLTALTSEAPDACHSSTEWSLEDRNARAAAELMAQWLGTTTPPNPHSLATPASAPFTVDDAAVAGALSGTGGRGDPFARSNDRSSILMSAGSSDESPISTAGMSGIEGADISAPLSVLRRIALGPVSGASAQDPPQSADPFSSGLGRVPLSAPSIEEPARSAATFASTTFASTIAGVSASTVVDVGYADLGDEGDFLGARIRGNIPVPRAGGGFDMIDGQSESDDDDDDDGPTVVLDKAAIVARNSSALQNRANGYAAAAVLGAAACGRPSAASSSFDGGAALAKYIASLFTARRWADIDDEAEAERKRQDDDDHDKDDGFACRFEETARTRSGVSADLVRFSRLGEDRLAGWRGDPPGGTLPGRVFIRSHMDKLSRDVLLVGAIANSYELHRLRGMWLDHFRRHVLPLIAASHLTDSKAPAIDPVSPATATSLAPTRPSNASRGPVAIDTLAAGIGVGAVGRSGASGGGNGGSLVSRNPLALDTLAAGVDVGTVGRSGASGGGAGDGLVSLLRAECEESAGSMLCRDISESTRSVGRIDLVSLLPSSHSAEWKEELKKHDIRVDVPPQPAWVMRRSVPRQSLIRSLGRSVSSPTTRPLAVRVMLAPPSSSPSTALSVPSSENCPSLSLLAWETALVGEQLGRILACSRLPSRAAIAHADPHETELPTPNSSGSTRPDAHVSSGDATDKPSGGTRQSVDVSVGGRGRDADVSFGDARKSAWAQSMALARAQSEPELSALRELLPRILIVVEDLTRLLRINASQMIDLLPDDSRRLVRLRVLHSPNLLLVPTPSHSSRIALFPSVLPGPLLRPSSRAVIADATAPDSPSSDADTDVEDGVEDVASPSLFSRSPSPGAMLGDTTMDGELSRSIASNDALSGPASAAPVRAASLPLPTAASSDATALCRRSSSLPDGQSKANRSAPHPFNSTPASSSLSASAAVATTAVSRFAEGASFTTGIVNSDPRLNSAPAISGASFAPSWSGGGTCERTPTGVVRSSAAKIMLGVDLVGLHDLFVKAATWMYTCEPPEGDGDRDDDSDDERPATASAAGGVRAARRWLYEELGECLGVSPEVLRVYGNRRRPVSRYRHRQHRSVEDAPLPRPYSRQAPTRPPEGKTLAHASSPRDDNRRPGIASSCNGFASLPPSSTRPPRRSAPTGGENAAHPPNAGTVTGVSPTTDFPVPTACQRKGIVRWLADPPSSPLESVEIEPSFSGVIPDILLPRLGTPVARNADAPVDPLVSMSD